MKKTHTSNINNNQILIFLVFLKCYKKKKKINRLQSPMQFLESYLQNSLKRKFKYKQIKILFTRSNGRVSHITIY